MALGLLPGPVPAGAQAVREPLRVVVVGDINLARLVARSYVLPGRGAEVFVNVTNDAWYWRTAAAPVISFPPPDPAPSGIRR